MKLNVTEGKPNPLQILYPTPIWLGYLDINKEKLIDLAKRFASEQEKFLEKGDYK